MSIKDFPATDTGIFHNPAQRRITLSWGKGKRRPSKQDLRALADLVRPENKDQMDAVVRLLEKADEVAHRVLLEEIRKADPKGHYFFTSGPCKMPDGSLIFRGVWKLVRNGSDAIDEKWEEWARNQIAVDNLRRQHPS
jgi:hypothetical protein